MDSNKPKKLFLEDSNNDGVFDVINYAIAIMAIVLILAGGVCKLYAAGKNNDKLGDASYILMSMGGGILIKNQKN